MTNNILMQVNNLVLDRRSVTVLDIEKLNVTAGKILVLIGPNGAGKSSLLLTLAGLLKFQKGRLNYQGISIKSGKDRLMLRRNCSVVFQESLLLDETVYKNVALGLKLRGKNNNIKADVEEALYYFGVNNLAQRSARNLSGGEAKRVSLARAFALKPQLILLDEPFSSLDPPTNEGIIDDLQRILEKTKITAVIASHNREETLRLAHDVAVMNNGKIIQIGTAAEVFNKPVNEDVADFVGAETILEGIVKSNHDGIMMITVKDKTIEATGNYAGGEKVYCCLRPENIMISREIQNKYSARNFFPAKVKKVHNQGIFNKLILDCGFPLVAYITKNSCEDLSLQEDDSVVASFKATAVHVIRREK